MVQSQSNAVPITNPNRAIVAAENAERIALRRSTATLAADATRANAQSLQRGFSRQIGGTFQEIQTLPSATVQPQQQRFGQEDIARFLEAFQFSPQREILAESRTTTASSRNQFAPGAINQIIQASRSIRVIDPITGQAVSRRGREGLFGGTILTF